MIPIHSSAAAIDTAAANDSALQSACDDQSLELPPLPEIAERVAKLAGDDSIEAEGADANATGALELARLIQRDVALAAQVMRVANSALYARGTAIVTLKQAISWLGLREIRRIAFSFAVRGQLFGATQFHTELTQLWRESVTTALFAQELARSKRRNVESAYLGGLLHRVGLAVILWRLGRAVRPQDFGARDSLAYFVAGFEPQVGSQLARAWQLPPYVAACIRHWRAPDAATADRIEVQQLALARALAVYAQEFVGDELPEALLLASEPLMAELGLYSNDLEAIFAKRAVVLSAADGLA
jgi:HD-like signal output (HDOD) protein